MKYSLLLVLFLPLSAFAQFGRTYTGPTMQQNLQSRQDFNRRMNQYQQNYQQQRMQQMQYRSVGRGQALSLESQQQARAKQLQLEQEANEKLAKLAEEQRLRREQHPAANPQQAALQQKKDAKQLNLLAVKNYREVFLPGQVATALDARQLSPKAQQQLENLNLHLANKAWLKQQTDAQLPGLVKAYGDTLNTLAAGLLSFDLASPPAMPAPLSVDKLNAQLATDAFDQDATTQLVREAALSEKLLAGEQLIKAVGDFNRLSTSAASPAPQAEPAKLREEVQTSLRQVNKALSRYNTRMSELTIVYEAQKALMKSTGSYVAKNGK